MSLKIIITGDGSHTLLNESLNETYHSVHGAIRESMHVFIDHGIAYAYDVNPRPLSVFEVGFGTGLNALLTARFAREKQSKVAYTSVEAFPLERQVWSQLNYPMLLNMPEEFKSMHHASWNEWQYVDEYFSFFKWKTSLHEVSSNTEHYDVIYLDAFAPSRQPEMWDRDILKKLAGMLNQQGVIVTYCAKGQLKRDFASFGLTVETLHGPPGKKEMVRVKNF